MKNRESGDKLPTQDEAIANYVKRQKEGENAPRGMTRREFLINLAKWTGGIALTGAIGAGAVKFLSSIGKDTGEGRSPVPPKEIPPTFDATATDTWIGPSNQTQMTMDQYGKIEPPIWDVENRTMTSVLPIKFKDGRTPTLHIQKMNDGHGIMQGNNLIQIDAGLREGDIIFSPFDGYIEAMVKDGKITQFYLILGTDTSFQNTIYFSSTVLEPMFDLKQTIKVNQSYVGIPIKKDEPIAEILASYNGQSFNPKVRIDGLSRSSFQVDLNLATTSQGRAVILK